MLVHGQAAPGELQDAAQPADQGQRGHPVEGAEAGHAETDGRGQAGGHSWVSSWNPGQPSTATGPGGGPRGWLPSLSGRVPSLRGTPMSTAGLSASLGDRPAATCSRDMRGAAVLGDGLRHTGAPLSRWLGPCFSQDVPPEQRSSGSPEFPGDRLANWRPSCSGVGKRVLSQ